MSLKPFQIPKEAYQNSEQDCDLALGLFMRGWGQVELSISALFRKLSGTDPTTANIIVAAGIDQRTMRNICDGLGKQRLKRDDYKKLEKLLGRIKTIAATRNRLIHGYWRIDLVIDEKTLVTTTATWIRYYEPIDPEAHDQIEGRRPNQKLRAAHVFTLDRIVSVGASASHLGKDIRDFVDKVILLPVRVPQPAF